MTTALATIPALPAARKDLAAWLAARTEEQLVFLCYEACEMPEYENVPCWFFDACYDESERRLIGVTGEDLGPLEVVDAPPPPAPMLHMMVGKKRIESTSLKVLSEKSGCATGSSSRWKPRTICTADGTPVAHVSYNGRVWAGTSWVPGTEPLYDPGAAGREAERAAYAAASIDGQCREVA